MKVKKFTGKNIQEIYQSIKLEMGNDAVILHTKKQKKGGFFGFFSKEFYEVTAAVEEFNYDEPKEEEEEQDESSQAALELLNRQITMPAEEKEEDEQEDKAISSEFFEMQKKMDEMMELLESSQTVFKGDFKKLYDYLLDQDTDPRIAGRIIKRIEKKYFEDAGQEDLLDLLQKEVFRIIKAPQPIDDKLHNKQRVIALVGPTGVGKTTTIAKLAANYTIKDKKDVSLLTVDTYRIAAVEQLKTVGEIIGVPVEVVFTPQNLKTAIQENSNKDLIFIDTAGRSHKNTMQMSEIKAFLDAAEADDTFLVLSSSTKYKDMLDIIEKYQELDINKIIFTKLDETTTFGSILNVADKTKKRLSYFTTGQNVPDDIEIAEQEKYFDLLIGDLDNESK